MRYSFRKVCGVEHLKQLRFKECKDLPAIASEEVFCPVESQKYWTIFDDKRYKIVARKIEAKEVKLVNLWLRKNISSHFISTSQKFYYSNKQT